MTGCLPSAPAGRPAAAAPLRGGGGGIAPPGGLAGPGLRTPAAAGRVCSGGGRAGNHRRRRRRRAGPPPPLREEPPAGAGRCAERRGGRERRRRRPRSVPSSRRLPRSSAAKGGESRWGVCGEGVRTPPGAGLGGGSGAFRGGAAVRGAEGAVAPADRSARLRDPAAKWGPGPVAPGSPRSSGGGRRGRAGAAAAGRPCFSAQPCLSLLREDAGLRWRFQSGLSCSSYLCKAGRSSFFHCPPHPPTPSLPAHERKRATRLGFGGGGDASEDRSGSW